MILGLASRISYPRLAKPRVEILREENRRTDLDGQLDVPAVIHHVVKSLLHIGSKMCPIFKNDANVSGAE